MATVSVICSSSTAIASQDHDLDINILDDSSLLMTLLEESSQVEDGDDESLRIVIQSLEAEITDQESCLETDVNSDVDCMEDDTQQQMDVHRCCSISPDHLDFEWNDEEMDYYYCPNDYMAGPFMGCFGDNMENMNDFVGVRDYSLISYGISMVEEEDYGGLWQ